MAMSEQERAAVLRLYGIDDPAEFDPELWPWWGAAFPTYTEEEAKALAEGCFQFTTGPSVKTAYMPDFHTDDTAAVRLECRMATIGQVTVRCQLDPDGDPEFSCEWLVDDPPPSSSFTIYGGFYDTHASLGATLLNAVREHAEGCEGVRSND